jgi:hypothetical protein
MLRRMESNTLPGGPSGDLDGPEVEREHRALRWLAGPQAFHDSPDSRDLSAVRDRRLARDERGRIVLTDAGGARLEELDRARTVRGNAP